MTCLKTKEKKQGEKNWPNMQILSKMAGYGLTKKGKTRIGHLDTT